MNDAAAMPAVLGFSAFARANGWKPSYVTGLRQAGRLVLTDDGTKVRTAESLQRIADTRDPSKVGVVERHAANRAAQAAAPAQDEGEDDDAGTPAAAAAAADDGGSRYKRARAMKEGYLAAGAKLDYEQRTGKLVDASQVRQVAADMGTTLRRRLESLAVLLSAMVDERDRDRIHTLVTEHIEETLSDLESAFARASARKETA